MVQAEVELREALESERFYEHLDVIRRAAGLLKNRYQEWYTQFHQQRLGAYTAAVEEIKGLPEWAQVANWVASVDEPVVREERQRCLEAVLGRLSGKVCDILDLSEESDACRTCRATIAQMESEIAAVEALKSQAIRELQELAAPEKKIVRVRVASILGSVIEKPDNPDDNEEFEARLRDRINELQEHLLKLLAEGARIILE